MKQILAWHISRVKDEPCTGLVINYLFFGSIMIKINRLTVSPFVYVRKQ